MGSKQRKIYNEVYDDIKKNIDKIISSTNPLSQLIRLRQATGYTGILSSTIEESAKLDRLEEIIEDIVADGEKAIIFSNWTSMTNEVEKRLKKYSPLVITGETSEQLRDLYVRQFQNDSSKKVMIGTIGALGTGLTLTSANNVIFLDEPWNMALREQAEDRAHRIGQNKSVNIYFLLTKGTIDERIHTIVEEKGEISDYIVDKEETINYLLS